MKIERTKNTIRNTKWGVSQKIVSILCPFFLRTALIYVLGAEYAGLSSLFTSILSILSLTELGFSNAIVYNMYKPVAEDDEDKICALLNIYRRAYLIIGWVILALGVILIPVLPYLISGDVPTDTNLYILYLVYLINTVISYFLFGYKMAILSAYQREDVISKNTLLYNVILYGLQFVVLFAFRNYYAYAIIIPLATVFLNLLNNRAVKKMFPNCKPAGEIDSDTKANLKKSILGIMIWKVGAATRNTLDSIVISMYLGLVAVAMYNNYFYIINGVITFLGVIITSITAGVGNKVATESPENNYKDFHKFHFYYMWISGWCAVCMMCLYQPFMSLWMGEKMMFPDYIMFMFCYYFIMLKQGDINYVYYQATGLWWEGKMRSIIEAVLNLILNLILGKYFGVAGIIVATIISFTCIYFYGSKFVFTKYFKNGRLMSFYVDNCIYLGTIAGAGIITFIITKAITNAIDFNIIGESSIVLILCVLIPNIIFAVVYSVRKQQRCYIRGVYNKLLRRSN